MLNNVIRLLNLDDSLTKQHNLLSRYKTEAIDLKKIAPQARLWMNQEIRGQIQERIRNLSKNSITLIGSGDFHHLSQLLLEQFKEPISVIVFDYHPDWDILPPRLGCGSWVTQSLKDNNILKFILLGVSSHDISTGYLQSGNLTSLKNDRLEIYPYAHEPSLVFLKRVPRNISLEVRNFILFKKVRWNELREKNLPDFFSSIIKRLPTKQVYISIDKDCLRKEYALTNWEEGLMSLEELLSALRLIKENLDIVGADIVGDYSPICVKGRLKAMFSRLDHPRDIDAAKFPESHISAINENTNLGIIDLLIS